MCFEIQDSLKIMALRVLREIIRRQPQRFKDYTELTIMKILQVQKDPQAKDVRGCHTLCHSVIQTYCTSNVKTM